MKQTLKFISTTLLAAATLTLSAQTLATDEYLITIKDHKFEPAEIKVPVGQKIKLVVHNQDQTPEEFESHDLKREKVVLGGKKITLSIGPLKAGSYGFMGEFNQDTAQGRIIAQ